MIPEDTYRPTGKMAEPRAFRGAFRALAAPVAVLLVPTPGGGVRGMTATSAVSLSGEPPMVLICPDDKTGMAELAQEAGVFSINFLAHGFDSIARAFSSAGRALDGVVPKIVLGQTGVPTLSFGTVSVLECELAYSYPGGDHSILCGLVRHARFQADAPPMLYGSGAYGMFQAPEPRHLAGTAPSRPVTSTIAKPRIANPGFATSRPAERPPLTGGEELQLSHSYAERREGIS